MKTSAIRHLCQQKQGEWVSLSSEQFCEQVDKVSLGLLKLGVEAGDRIAIISEGRPEWSIIDFGIQQVGGYFDTDLPHIDH